MSRDAPGGSNVTGSDLEVTLYQIDWNGAVPATESVDQARYLILRSLDELVFGWVG